MSRFKSVFSLFLVCSLLFTFSLGSVNKAFANTEKIPSKFNERITGIDRSELLVLPTKIPELPTKPNYAVQPPPGGGGSSDHTLDRMITKTVYGDPRDMSAENGLALGIISIIPALSQYTTLMKIIGGAGLVLSWNSFVNDDKPKNKFTIYHWVYKSKKPTSTYWGYYVVDIYNHDTGKTSYGKGVAIGKRSY